ncbi:MAG: HK97 gp10 family phage protein [Muricomes sp.]
MPEIEFEDNRIEVKGQLKIVCLYWLYEVAGEIQAAVMRNTRVDTSKTKGSWEYKVDSGKMEAYVGSNYENAVWEEFGTGQYALEGNGRKSPWAYKDIKGKWHVTVGKRPRRALYKAFTYVSPRAKKYLEQKLRGV